MARYLPLIAVLWMMTALTYAQNPYYQQVFSQKTGEEKLTAARHVFETRISGMDSVTAIAMLKDLKLRADQQEEQGLQIFFTEAMGLYYIEHNRSAEMPALFHLEAALALAITYKYQELQAEIYHNMGLLYYRRDKFLQAFEALFKANGIIQYSIGYGRYPYAARYLYDLGLVYYDFGNYAKAKDCLQDALYYTTVTTTRTIETYNTLGLTYRSVELYDSAAHCFQKAITLASALHHSAWVGIASGNLGRIFFMQQKYAAALPLLKADYELSIKNNEFASAAATLCTLAEIKMMNNEYKGAAEDLAQALDLEAGEEKIDDRLMLQYTLVQAILCKKRKLFECAAVFLDSARILQSRITDRKNGILLAQVEKNIEVEKYLTDLKLLASEKSKAVLLRNFIIISASCCC